MGVKVSKGRTNIFERKSFEKLKNTFVIICFQKVENVSLALPSYVLLLNLDFASVLGLAIRYASQILQVDFLPANQRTKGVAENDDVDVVHCLCCNSVMAAKKDASEAIRSVWQHCRISTN